MRKLATGVVVASTWLGLVGCGSTTSANAPGGDQASKNVTIYFGSYSVTKDVYENQLFPAFEKYWKDKTGQTVTFQASFDASGAEARAIASGLPADVAALSLADDINKIQKAGLITHDWTADPYHGMVTDSIVTIGVRKGNPKHIHDWADLGKPGVVVDLPNPETSGGAKWDINAIYGAGLQGSSPDHAKALLASIVKNVQVLDKSGEASMTTFVNGVGDAVVSYENEILEKSDNLQLFDEVVPASTTLIENPIAVVDKNVEKHGNRQVVQAFVDFLRSPDAQKIYVQAGFRPVNANVPTDPKKFPHPPKLFTVADLGGWSKVNQTLYSENGVFSQILSTK